MSIPLKLFFRLAFGTEVRFMIGGRINISLVMVNRVESRFVDEMTSKNRGNGICGRYEKQTSIPEPIFK